MTSQITRLSPMGLPGPLSLLGQSHIRLYQGQDGVMDYDHVQAVMFATDSQVTLQGQDLPPNTLWSYAARAVNTCGVESDDAAPAARVRIDENGDVYAAPPNAPTDLTAEQVAGGKIKLRWRYAAFGQAAVPDAFRIVQDGLLVATVSVKGASLSRGQRALPPWTSGALTHGQLYRYQVRAYNTTSGGESLNSNSISIAADAVGPTAITGLTATVEAIG